MIRSMANKVAWIGRTVSTVFGLALVLALVLGVGTMALAAVPGDPFKLGKINSINAISQLVGSVAGPMLRIDNNGGGPALKLEANAGKPPLKVNAAAGKATNLNADKLDGKDSTQFANGVGGKATNADKLDGKDSSEFLAAHGIYAKTSAYISGNANDSTPLYWSCDSGDKALSGSYELRNDGWEVASDTVSFNGHPAGVPSAGVPANTGYYYLLWRDTNGSADSALMTVVCLDIGTPHQ